MSLTVHAGGAIFEAPMVGLNLGDMVFDARRFIYVKSLRALVCSGFQGQFDPLLEGARHYGAETVVMVGLDHSIKGIQALKSFSEHHLRVQLVSSQDDPDFRLQCERGAVDFNGELVWGRYRFSDALEPGKVELYFVSAIGRTIGGQHFGVRVGQMGLGGRKLPVFLKGMGQVLLPSLNPQHRVASVFRKPLVRYDVFAVGHHRVFPLGKVADLKEVKFMGRIPLNTSTLGQRRPAAAKA